MQEDDDRTIRLSDKEVQKKESIERVSRVLFRSREPTPDPRGRKKSNPVVRRAEQRTRKRSRSRNRTPAVFDLATLDRGTTTPGMRVRRVKRWMQRNSKDTLYQSSVTSTNEGSKELADKKPRAWLPVEIWCEIFNLRNHEDERDYEETPTRRPFFNPLLLSAVCRDWRSIVLKHPPLWQYIAIPLNEKISHRQRDRILHYSACLSSHLPIAYTYERIRARKEPNDLVTVLHQAFPKYEVLEVHKGRLLNNRVSSSFLAKLSPETNSLRLVSHMHTRMIDRDCWSLSGSAIRNVRKMSCLGVSIRIQRTPRDAPELFTKLRSLAIRDTVCFSADLQECLEHLVGIEHLELDGTTIRSTHSLKRITMPSLTSVSCNLVQYYELHFFGSAPNLRTLELRLLEAHYKSHWERFSHLAVGQAAIQTLQISSPENLKHSPKGEQMYLDIIQHFNRIQVLELGGAFAVLSLQVLPTPHIPLKELRSVVIRQSGIEEDVIDAFWSRFQLRHGRSLDINCQRCSNVDSTGRTPASFSASN